MILAKNAPLDDTFKHFLLGLHYITTTAVHIHFIPYQLVKMYALIKPYMYNEKVIIKGTLNKKLYN